MLFNIVECLGDLGFGNRGSVITNAYRQCRAFHRMIDNHENGEFREIRLKDYHSNSSLVALLDNRTSVVFSHESRKVGKQWLNSIGFRINGPEFVCEQSRLDSILLAMQSKVKSEYDTLIELCKDYSLNAEIQYDDRRVGILNYNAELPSKAKSKRLNTKFVHPVIVKPFYMIKVNY